MTQSSISTYSKPLMLGVACVCFGAALALPLFSIHPAAGEWTRVLAVLSTDQFRAQEVTLPSGIASLWRNREILLAVIVSALSILLPVAKLCVLWWESFGSSPLHKGAMRFLKGTARFAMAEVFVIALFVIVIKAMPGGTHIGLRAGSYFFIGSVFASLLAAGGGHSD